MLRGIGKLSEELPPSLIKTITFDNGREFAHHRKLEEILQCSVYFADPYAAWQRGLNEYVNRQYRRYLPQDRQFDHLTDEQIRAIQDAKITKP